MASSLLLVARARAAALLLLLLLLLSAAATLWAPAAEAHGDHDIKNFHRFRGSGAGSAAAAGGGSFAHHIIPPGDRAHVESAPVPVMLLSENATELEKWLMAGDVATYRSVSEILSVSLPVHINLIFVGFDDDGQHGMELLEDNFSEWFEHIDHFIRHRIVPVGEEQTTTERYRTPKTYVRYQYNLVKLDPLVNTIVEDTIYWHLRPENPASIAPFQGQLDSADEYIDHSADQSNPERFYVDAYKVSRVLYHLLLSLNLTDTYTLFLLNPKNPLKENQVYGYRVGFSDAEIQELQKRSDEWSVDLSKFRAASEMPTQGIDLPPNIDTLFPRKVFKTNETYETLNFEAQSQEWANWYLQHMIQGGVKLKHLCTNKESGDDVHCLWKSQRAEQRDIVKLAAQIAESGTKAQAEYLQNIKAGIAREQCLVDTWIGHARYGWIDLSAGPFKWGPVIAGQGVRSLSTLPRVPPYYALHPEADPQRSDDGEIQPSPSPRPINQIASKAQAEEYRMQVERLNAEAQMLQGIWEKRCTPPVDVTECLELLEAMKKVKEQIETGKMELQNTLVAGHEEEGEGALLLLDNFLAHLASAISRSIAHVFVPATPLFPAYYTHRITFHFFIIANHQKYNPQDGFDFDIVKSELLKFKLPEQEFSFVVKELDMSEDRSLTMAFIQSLRTSVIPTLSAQGEFSTQTIRYIDSKELQHQLDLINVHAHADIELQQKAKVKDGTVKAGESAEEDAENENDDHYHEESSSLPERSGKGRTSRHIPIFIFSLDDGPVFIDKYYQAKALSNVVLAVQSRNFNWTSRLACNGKSIYWDLSDPSKALLGAISLHYGGLIPMHISYDEPNQCAMQDWTWSVGESPFAHTSSHYRFNLIQRDLVMRNFITNAIEDSISAVNRAVKILKKIRTTSSNFGAIRELPLSELLYSYRSLRRLWDMCARAFATVNFNVVPNLYRLEEQTKSFVDTVGLIDTYIDVMECAPSKDGKETDYTEILMASSDGTSWWVVPSALVFNVILMVLWLLLRRNSRKVKTN